MAQTQTVRGVATSIRTDHEGVTHVRYHSTDVVSFSATRLTLRAGGWRTVTTKARMNQASNQFGLGFSVYSERGDWYVRFFNDDRGAFVFKDGMTFDRRTRTVVHKRRAA